MRNIWKLLTVLAVAGGLAACDKVPSDSDPKKYDPVPESGKDQIVKPFKTILGKSDEEIQNKLDELWYHYFEDASSKVYFERGDGAYILDASNNDIRAFEQSYGMMICVQTNHKEEFDKLWSFAKNNMWNESGSNQGHFEWRIATNGQKTAYQNEPGADIYFAAALLFADARWGKGAATDYDNYAQKIMSNMFNPSKPFFATENGYYIYFQTNSTKPGYTISSYNLPTFLDLFALRSAPEKNLNEGFTKAANASREILFKSCNIRSGLFPDYCNSDGTPKSVSFYSDSEKYYNYGHLCPMNFGMDYYLTGKDKVRQQEMAKRLITFFEKDNYIHSSFSWDGVQASDRYLLRQVGANAVACFALFGDKEYSDAVKRNLEKAWDAELQTGPYRTYDGLIHYMSMLHLCESFKIWYAALKKVDTER